MRLHSVSLYNNDGDVLWLSEGALGPDEHNVVVEGIEHLKVEKNQLYHELGMEDGRIAIFLGIRAPRGDLVGTIMILADMKSVSEGTMERVLSPPVKMLMQKMAMFLRKAYPQASSGDTSQLVAVQVPPAADARAVAMPTAVPPGANGVAATTRNIPVLSEPLAPKQVEAILTLELVDEPAVAEPVKTGGHAKGATPPVAKAAPVVKAVPRKAPAAAANASAAVTNGKNAGGNAQRGQVPTVNAAPAPLREIEVLAFDANIQIPTARAASAPAAPFVAEAEMLAFDANIQIPTAQPAAAAPSADIEVLDFDAELTIPPASTSPLAKAAPIAVEPPVAKAAASTALDLPVVKAAPLAEAPMAKTGAASGPAPKIASTVSLELPVAKSSSASADVPVAKAAATSLDLPVAKGPSASLDVPVARAPVVEPAASKAATLSSKAVDTKSNSSQTASIATPNAAKAATSDATVSVPLFNTSSTTTTSRAPKSAADEAMLINDTGPVKKLELPEEAPALPAAPPPAALTVEETATDLTLFVQELIKLRSSGRTRRYEVLARSQRDAGRNEVPTAFIAESAKGQEGAALDALVLERLLQWLGTHGETIWDSEPASFSVNLSIGALEDARFPEKIGKWLEQYNVPAEHVGFEISEFACVQCRPAVQRFVEACERLGCFLVIDNFSFDSSMFEFLGSKALRHVKIDPKLTTAAMKEKLPQALVVAILQACKVLGVHCVAKRIDSQASLQWLTAVGCDFAQSFQLEKPTNIDTLVSGKSIKALRE